MVVQLSLTIQQESVLKRRVIDAGHINVNRVRIEDGEGLESGVRDSHVNNRRIYVDNRRRVVSGQLVRFHIIMDTHFLHAVVRDRVHLT